MNAQAAYRKKPVTIMAWQLTPENAITVKNWINGRGTNLSEDASVFGNAIGTEIRGVYIPTLEGEMEANIGDWIIEGVEGEFYPCKPAIFEKTYEAVAMTQTVGVR